MNDGTYIKTERGFEPVFMKTGYWVGEYEVKDLSEDLEIGDYLGVWTDPFGKVWYDRTHLILDLGTAYILANKWKQFAIWDNENKVAITPAPGY